MRILLGFSLTLLLATTAHAASFDCHKAATPVEKRICADLDLSPLDSQVAAAYLGALDRSLHPEAVKQGQAAWLKTRDACADVACMKAAYRARVKALSAMSDAPKMCAGGSTPEINECLTEYMRRADLELGRYVAAVRRTIREQAEGDPPDPGARNAIKEFDQAEAAWAAYRKAECDATYDLWSSGTIRGAMYGECYLSITKARSLTLWSTWLRPMEDDAEPDMPKPEIGRAHV